MTARPDRPLLVALVACLLVGFGSCKQIGTRAYNLDELHGEGGRHQRTGNLLSDFGYGLHNGFLGIFNGISEDSDKDAERFDDPVKACIENLVLLAEFDSDRPRLRALQVDWFARLAVGDPWALSRACSVRNLGRIGEHLDITLEQRLPPGAEVATPEEARELLARLVAATRPLVARQGLLPRMGVFQTPPKWDYTAADAPPDLRSICSQIEAAPLDLQGGLRMLRAAALLEHATAAKDKRVKPLRDAVLHLERVCIREALLAALLDQPPEDSPGSHPGWQNPKVRAAGLVAAYKVLGPDVLAQFLQRLDVQDDVVILAALNLVRRDGLPRPSQVTDEDWLELQARWIETILRRGTDHPSGQVRVRALAALASIRGDGSHSLSEDDWYAWWRDEVRPSAPAGEPQASPPPAP